MLGDRGLGGRSGRVVLARKVSRGVGGDAGDAENLLARKVSIGGVSRGVSRGFRGVSGDAGEGANPVESIGIEGHPGESVVHQTVQIFTGIALLAGQPGAIRNRTVVHRRDIWGVVAFDNHGGAGRKGGGRLGGQQSALGGILLAPPVLQIG